jgi:nucleotide-binding universal stress UspA family protein
MFMLPLKKILWPTDFSEPAEQGLKIGLELATQFSAEMILVHVVAPMPTMHGTAAPTGFHIPSVLEELQESARMSLEEIRQTKIPAEIKSTTCVVNGKPAREIVRLAAQEKVDIIVIPTQGESGWQRFVFGSVAEKVVRLADCPVLTIHAPAEDEE